MKQNFGIVIYDLVQPIDVIGPWEVMAMWQQILNAPIDMMLISENGDPVTADNKIVLNAHTNFADAPQMDYLLVPGGQGRRAQVDNLAIIKFIQQQAKHCKYLLSVCTGVFLLQKAGLLDHKEVTTYWRAIPELGSLPNIRVNEQRIVKSNNIWTSGGISSGIDLALALIAEIAGKEVAGQVQLIFEYFPRDTLYATKNSKNTLPPYNPNERPEEVALPAYILDEM